MDVFFSPFLLIDYTRQQEESVYSETEEINQSRKQLRVVCNFWGWLVGGGCICMYNLIYSAAKKQNRMSSSAEKSVSLITYTQQRESSIS